MKVLALLALCPSLLAAPAAIVPGKPLPPTFVSVVTLHIRQANPDLSQEQADAIAKYTVSSAADYNVDPTQLVSLMFAESRFNVTAHSGYGAQGLTQVVPRFHQDKLKGRSLRDPKVAIEVGAHVLADCQRKHKGNMTATLNCYSGYTEAVPKYHGRIKAFRASLIASLRKTRHA